MSYMSCELYERWPQHMGTWLYGWAREIRENTLLPYVWVCVREIREMRLPLSTSKPCVPSLSPFPISPSPLSLSPPSPFPFSLPYLPFLPCLPCLPFSPAPLPPHSAFEPPHSQPSVTAPPTSYLPPFAQPTTYLPPYQPL
jgi:hypothetical protein